MKRSQVTAMITRWEGKGALYIVAHARYQRQRGKNPSEPYRGETNPRKALLLALNELKTYIPMAGSYIPLSIAQMVGIAKFTNQQVTGTFDGVTVTADPNSAPEALAAAWKEEFDRQARKYRESPEHKVYLLERARQVRERREKIADMMQRLETLNFGDLDAVVDWFDEIQEASDDIDVTSVMRQEEIVQKFQMHGYRPNANLGDEFNGEDKENFAHYLVGQALDNLATVGAVHHMYKVFAQDWRNKFADPSAGTENIN